MHTAEKQGRKESSAARGYELSDAEKRDLIALLQAGKPLPERYRFLLFADKREVELVWNGKTRDVCTAILPFQILDYIDEPRKEKHEENQLLGFDSRQAKGWTNKLIWGDNKLILSSLKSGALRRQIEEAGCLKLIYIDPPFDVGGDTIRGSARKRSRGTINQPAFLYPRKSPFIPGKRSFQPGIHGDGRR